ncbi:hypothetical protein NLG97_g3264 [Lecanicillium saksenae]|uniref:Uncharacterized protein n=1 Tax=Lecanicillium saksenae TaxID=468837 RepID=A0ACC1QYK8_9HYPO|nr:hypothetical protein NLG97_g3264 [Lecanicillium saksenae]
MATEGPAPRVGVAAVVINRQGQVLVGKRKGSHGAGKQAGREQIDDRMANEVLRLGTWQFPGGHLEHGEALIDCAVREALEETDLTLQGIKIVTQTNDVFVAERKHYITLFALCKMENFDAEPKVLEPEKCESWLWWDWEKFYTGRDSGLVDGAPLFLPMKNLLQQFKSVDELKQTFQ